MLATLPFHKILLRNNSKVVEKLSKEIKQLKAENTDLTISLQLKEQKIYDLAAKNGELFNENNELESKILIVNEEISNIKEREAERERQLLVKSNAKKISIKKITRSGLGSTTTKSDSLSTTSSKENLPSVGVDGLLDKDEHISLYDQDNIKNWIINENLKSFSELSEKQLPKNLDEISDEKIPIFLEKMTRDERSGGVYDLNGEMQVDKNQKETCAFTSYFKDEFFTKPMAFPESLEKNYFNKDSYKLSSLQANPLKLSWKRPFEMSDSPKFLKHNFEDSKIVPGLLNNITVATVLNCLACYPEIILKSTADIWNNEVSERIRKNQSPNHRVNKVFNLDPSRNGEYNAGKYTGKFIFNFYYYNKWVEIIIDDRLPVIQLESGKYVYFGCSSTDENEFWPALLEKAFVKLIGGYHLLADKNFVEVFSIFGEYVLEKSGITSNDITKNASRYKEYFKKISDNLKDRTIMNSIIMSNNTNNSIGKSAANALTNGVNNDHKTIQLLNNSLGGHGKNVTNQISHSPKLIRKTYEQYATHDQISNGSNDNEIITTNTNNNRSINLLTRPDGLLVGKFYTITGLQKFTFNKNTHRIIRLKNLTNKVQWTGKYSAIDPIWDQTTNSNHTKNDSEFWMPFEKFCKIFNKLEVFKTGAFYENYEVKELYSEWVENSRKGGMVINTSGGLKDRNSNPYLGFSIDESNKNCQIFLNLKRYLSRHEQLTNYKKVSGHIGALILKVKEIKSNSKGHSNDLSSILEDELSSKRPDLKDLKTSAIFPIRGKLDFKLGKKIPGFSSCGEIFPTVGQLEVGFYVVVPILIGSFLDHSGLEGSFTLRIFIEKTEKINNDQI